MKNAYIEQGTVEVFIGNKPKTQYHVNPMYIENKTKRVQLVLKPSVYAKAKRDAATCGASLNEWVNTLLESAIVEVHR